MPPDQGEAAEDEKEVEADDSAVVAGAAKEVELFGCPEDWVCKHAERHAAEEKFKGVLLCEGCTLPVCKSCATKLATAKGRNNVPMALANDNWYGYVQDIIARYDARWIECALVTQRITPLSKKKIPISRRRLGSYLH